MDFYSKLMVASPRLSNGAFNWLGDLSGSDAKGNKETIHVIAWNCEDKDGIAPLIEKTIQEAEQKEQTPQLLDNVARLHEYLDEINCGVFEHKVPFLLMAAAVQQIRDTYGNTIANELSSEKFMYLSSVDIRTVGK